MAFHYNKVALCLLLFLGYTSGHEPYPSPPGNITISHTPYHPSTSSSSGRSSISFGSISGTVSQCQRWRGFRYFIKNQLGLTDAWKKKSPKDWSSNDFAEHLAYDEQKNFDQFTPQEQYAAARQFGLYEYQAFRELIPQLPAYQSFKNKLKEDLQSQLDRITMGLETWYFPERNTPLEPEAVQGMKWFYRDQFLDSAGNTVPPPSHRHQAPSPAQSAPTATIKQAQTLRTVYPKDRTPHVKTLPAYAFYNPEAIIERYQKRISYLHHADSLNSRIATYTKVDEVPDALIISKTERNQLKTLDGIPVQHVLQTEYVTLLKETGALYTQHEEHRFLYEWIAESVAVGTEYNHKKEIVQAWYTADWCWALYDCAAALCTGIRDGAINAADTCLHPVQSICGLASAIKQAGYVAAWITWQGTCITRAAMLEDWDEFDHRNQQLALICTALWDNLAEAAVEKTASDWIHDGTAFVVEAFCVGKLVGTIASSLGKAAHCIKRARSLPALAPQAVTAEGVTIEVGKYAELLMMDAEELGGAGTARKLGRMVGPDGPCLDHCYVGLEQRSLKMLEPHQEMFKSRLGTKIRGIDFEHAFEGHLKKKGKGVSGGHSTYFHPERFVEAQTDAHGVIKGRWKLNGKSKGTTCFPKEMSPTEICDIVVDALANMSNKFTPTKDGLKFVSSSGLYEAQLSFFIDNTGLITTFYPLRKVVI